MGRWPVQTELWEKIWQVFEWKETTMKRKEWAWHIWSTAREIKHVIRILFYKAVYTISWHLYPQGPSSFLNISWGPTWSNCTISSKQMKASSTKAKMFNYMKNFYRLFYIANFRFFRDNQVNVNISMNEVPICATLNRSFDPHKAVFLNNNKSRAISLFISSHIS